MSETRPEMLERLAQEAYLDCRRNFIADEGREPTPDEDRALQKIARLGIRWAEQKPASYFRPRERRHEAVLRGRWNRRERMMNRREQRRAERDFDRFLRANWDEEGVESLSFDADGNAEIRGVSSEDGVGFFIAFLTAVFWQIAVVLAARWVIVNWFIRPSVASAVCLPG